MCNVASPHWRRWLAAESRCLLPATSFSEYGRERGPDGKLPLHWFDIFAFLTTEANAVVAPIHDKAMPAIVTEPEEIETWLTAPWEEAKGLQRPLPDGQLSLMA
jgi:putative SOS response-associated peptidase YedK